MFYEIYNFEKFLKIYIFVKINNIVFTFFYYITTVCEEPNSLSFS